MEITTIWTCLMVFFLICCVISKIIYIIKQSYWSKIWETAFLTLLIIGNVIGLMLRNHFMIVRCAITLLLLVVWVYNMFKIRHIHKMGDNFVRIHGRTYIVRNIYDKD